MCIHHVLFREVLSPYQCQRYLYVCIFELWLEKQTNTNNMIVMLSNNKCWQIMNKLINHFFFLGGVLFLDVYNFKISVMFTCH